MGKITTAGLSGVVAGFCIFIAFEALKPEPAAAFCNKYQDNQGTIHHKTYMEQREEVASKLLENSYPYDSFFNWLGEGNGESKQTLVEALEEQGVAISTTTKSTFAVSRENAM